MNVILLHKNKVNHLALAQQVRKLCDDGKRHVKFLSVN